MLRIQLLIACITTILLLLFLSACGGGGSRTLTPTSSNDLTDAKAYKDSPYSSEISHCIRPDVESDLCSLRKLPFIGLETSTPDIDDLMDHVVVSHDWMGLRFEEALGKLPSEMLSLFQAVTAIVIDSDIRPSHYSPTTGAIYLDPYFLWLSVDEKRTINLKQDYRSGYDDPLSFRVVNRYLKNGQPAFYYASLSDNSTRQIDDIILPLAGLLLHELAHANDFTPPGSYSRLAFTQTALQANQMLEETQTSLRLKNTMPIDSPILLSLAGVMYRGLTPSMEELQLQAHEVGQAFEPDGASAAYGYSSRFEDTAMLFEIAMMKYFFNVDHEIAFTNVPENPRHCNYYTIGWGVKGRVGDLNVKPRAQFVASETLPNTNFGVFFQDIETPTSASGTWCLDSYQSQTLTTESEQEEVPVQDLIRPYL